MSGARVATDRIVAWTVAFAAALAFAGFDRTISRAQAATSDPCTATGIGEAAALQLNGNAPIVAGRNGVVAVYESFLADSRFQAPAKSPQLYCTGASGVVGIAAYLGILYVADARTVHALDADTGEPKGSFAPALAPNEAIAAIALLPGGDVELALASAAIGSDARQPVTTRFVIYAKPVNASGLAPLRTFTCDSFLAPVSAIASDTKGRTYAYDDGGEILIFRAGATGATKPTTRFSGTASALRPAARSSARGSRQMALDILGSLYAADDGSIVRFGVADDGQNAQSDFMAYDPPSHLGIVRGLATDNESNLYVLSIDPRTAAAAIRVYRRIGHALALSVTLP